MNINEYGHGIFEFEKCLPDQICDYLIDLYMTNPEERFRLDHISYDYTKGTQYTELLLDNEGNKTLKEKLSNHIAYIQSEYFKLIGIGKENSLTNFYSPVIKHYDAGRLDRFLVHCDSVGQYSMRGLAMIWYLTDANGGGETVFPFHDVKIPPQKGSCLMFPPFWNYPHLARKPLNNDKITLNTFGCYDENSFPTNGLEK